MVERIYYPINEDLAKQAHNMMSFREYKTGSLTEEYKGDEEKPTFYCGRRGNISG